MADGFLDFRQVGLVLFALLQGGRQIPVGICGLRVGFEDRLKF